MPTNRIAAVLRTTAILRTTAATVFTIAAAILLSACGGGSTATQSAGVSSLTTTSSVASAPATTSTTASASTSSTASSAATSTTSTSRAPHSKSAKPAETGGTAVDRHAAKQPTAKQPIASLAVSSAAFPHGGQIPVRYTCEGGNVSPPLQWGKVPAGTSQMFLIALSLTAGTQGGIRWAVGGIDPSSGGFAAGQLPAGAIVGRSSDGHVGWAGICPVKGKPQAVIVMVYALRHPLRLAPGFEPSKVQAQLTGNTVGRGVVYGAYKP
jgi:phosphatidylethanolamine-binding protein (PEBP) family uncharacterized protein